MSFFSMYRREIAAERERIARAAQVVETSAGSIQYATLGEGIPLLAIHGAGGGFDQGLDIAGSIAGAGYRVIAPSRFGYLGTPLPADASAPAQARAHASLLDALGIHETNVVGASAGAPSAMQFAIEFPERTKHLILMVPAAYAPRTGGAPSVTPPSGLTFLFDTALRSDFLFWALLRGAPKLATRAILATPPEVVAAASLPEKARVAKMMRHILPVSPRRLGLLNDAAVTRAIPRYPLERIASPTLVLSAKDDGYGTWDCARYTAENIPNARFLGFESGGHLLVGHQDELRAEILAFLDPFCRILPPPFDNPLKARQSQPIEGGLGNE